MIRSPVFKEYIRQVIAGLDIDPATDRLPHIALGLAGEAGEVADLVKKSQYKINHGYLPQGKMIEELGDILWYLTAAAWELGYDLEEIMEVNIRKLQNRRGGAYDVDKLIHAGEDALEDVPAVPLGYTIESPTSDYHRCDCRLHE